MSMEDCTKTKKTKSTPKKRKKNFTLIDRGLLGFIRRICRALSIHFDVKYKSVHIMDTKDSWYFSTWGYCQKDVLVIKVRKNGKYINIEEIVDTIAHEMAHVLDDEGDDVEHSPEWRKRYLKYKRWLYRRVDIKEGETSCHLD